MLEYTIDEKGAFCKDGHTMFTLDILQDLKRMAYLETLYANDKENACPNLIDGVCELTGQDVWAD